MLIRASDQPVLCRYTIHRTARGRLTDYPTYLVVTRIQSVVNVAMRVILLAYAEMVTLIRPS